jgi:bifunctional non-homologous end joining protein LigD
MKLKEYQEKRNFNKTPEPAGEEKPANVSTTVLEFVVQRHRARSLHYDFRLLLDGVLKSWAIPKGPSLNPKDKHLAVRVEDHPYEYIHFKGDIEPGNYGAGHVEIWDSGTYMPLNADMEPADEAYLLKHLELGTIKFFLNGNKLKGSFALVKMHVKTGKDNAWLIIKHEDEYAVHEPYDAEDHPRHKDATV